MKKSDYLFVTKSFFIWLAAIFFFIFLAIKFIPLQKEFLGGGLSNYLANPFLWAWGNFDGEHYIAIAQNGYQPLTYFFFPLYPLLIKYLAVGFGSSVVVFEKTGILISLVSLFVGMVGLVKLLKLDYKDDLIKITILFLLIFPTSFFFASVYTESLFFALAVWSLYFARSKKWIWAGVIAGLATATRIIGLALVAALVVEGIIAYKKDKKLFLPILAIFLSLAGFAIYICYLWMRTGDPLNFLHTVSIFGAQRSGNFILLPQVFYRYVFKVLPNLNYTVFSSFFPSVFEFVIALVFLGISILAFWKTRFSYAIYLALGYLIPTLSGSFSSLPRYVLILFPAFVVLAQILAKKKSLLVAFSLISFILLAICLAFFTRGYWIS